MAKRFSLSRPFLRISVHGSLLYYSSIEKLESFRSDLSHTSLAALTIYIHYALRPPPRLAQIHLENLPSILIEE